MINSNFSDNQFCQFINFFNYAIFLLKVVFNFRSIYETNLTFQFIFDLKLVPSQVK